MQPINDVENEIIEEFASFDDWMGKFEHLIEVGKAMPGLDEAERTDDRLIHGCQARVWVIPSHEQGRVYFRADSDAHITRGLVALLVRVLSGRTPDEVANAELRSIEAIGLKEHLSPSRSNGLRSMIKQMKRFAAEAAING